MSQKKVPLRIFMKDWKIFFKTFFEFYNKLIVYPRHLKKIAF